MKNTFIVFALMAFAATAFAQERFVKPLDEGGQDASFSAFRKKLIAAVDRKDMAHILTIVDRNIKNSFGGNDGVAEFKKQWKNSDEFWKEFGAVIKNGGQFTGDGTGKKNSFSAPYLFTAWPENVDAFEYNAVFGNDVNLRETPELKGKIVTKLSYNIVKVNYDESKRISPNDDELAWIRVESLGGLKGWISSPYVRSSIDYRAGFEKIRGVWKMTFFLAGD